MCLLLILSNKLDLNQDTRFTIVPQTLRIIVKKFVNTLVWSFVKLFTTILRFN